MKEEKLWKRSCSIHKDGECYLWYLYQRGEKLYAVCADCENNPAIRIKTTMPLKLPWEKKATPL